MVPMTRAAPSTHGLLKARVHLAVSRRNLWRAEHKLAEDDTPEEAAERARLDDAVDEAHQELAEFDAPLRYRADLE